MLNLAPKIVSPLLDLRSRSEIYLFAGPCELSESNVNELVPQFSMSMTLIIGAYYFHLLTDNLYIWKWIFLFFLFHVKLCLKRCSER